MNDDLLRRAEDLERRYLLPGRGTPAEQAFTALCGAQTVDSLQALVKVAGRPLLTWRCAHDGAAVAAIWETSAEPLLVSGHRVETWTRTDRTRTGRSVPRSWTPRVALPNDDLTHLLPPPCANCHSLRPLTHLDMGRAVVAARRGGPRTVKV